MTGAALEAKGLGYAVRGQAILRTVDIVFAPGTFTAVLGPNGAGKTTLLRLLVGALRPTTGEVRLGDAPFDSLPRIAVARRLSYLPQATATRFDVTVWDAVAMGRFAHRPSWRTLSERDLAVVRGALERVDLGDLVERTLPTLSGGELQRVFLARALAQEAEVLVLDEPTNALDVRHQLELMDIAARLHADGKTIVAAMHDLDLVWNSVPDTVLLDRGRVVTSGPSREVLLAPEAAAVFGVRLEGTDDGLRYRR